MDNAGTSHHPTGFEIAIIGMAGRFPGARSYDAFWQNLRNGVESISFFTDEEIAASHIDSETLADPNYVKAGGVIEDAEFFDAQFFGFTPMEAQTMDPQHRIFLECAWEALEDAGYDAEKYTGSIGIYAGVAENTYLVNNILSNHKILESVDGMSSTIASDKDFLTTRVAYKLNLKGPAVVVQTACSTSLAAVHLASQSLLTGECDMALGGGVSVKFPQKRGYYYQEGGILSPDGHCKAFDADARGTVGGNGLGILVLKRLSDALADGDHIYAVIKGSAINNDGSLKVGYTAPGVEGQAEAIKKALAMAEVPPETVRYIEAHGTGTALGDVVEITALNQAFNARTDKNAFCAIGSVKTNIGHLNTAAGVAGLIKTVMSLKHRELPPSLHFTEPNPKIDFTNSPFYVNNTLARWEGGHYPRRAGISSFGIGGTNAHVVLEEAPVEEPSAPSRPHQLLLLSAKTRSALEKATRDLVGHMKKRPELSLPDAVYTLQVGRREFGNRRAVVCQSVEDAIVVLEAADSQRVFTALADSDDRPVAFMFSGQGSQYVNMGLALYHEEPAFRTQIDICAAILTPLLGQDIRDVLYPDETNIDTATRRLTQTSMTQPALFAIEYALAMLLAEWGIRPTAMIGHSIGEYVAACLSGVFSLQDALALVATRGRLMQALPAGAMLAVPLPEVKIRALLGKQLSLAAINGPSLCVVSGPSEAVAQLKSRLTAQGVSCRQLHTSHAFHSEMMAPIQRPFVQQVRKSTLNPPQIPFVSNVTGRWITPAEATDPGYWVRHLRQTVCFSQGVETLLKGSAAVLLEVGPGDTLRSLIRQHPAQSPDQVVLTSIHHPRDQHPDTAFLLNTLGRLWLAGVKIDWAGFYAREKRHRIPLPTYPFERQRYWVEPQAQGPSTKAATGLAAKRPSIADWFYIPSWRRTTPLKRDNDDRLKQKKLTWLIFIDEYGVGAAIAARLEQAGQHVVRVTVGEKFSKVNDELYHINPRTSEEYGELLKELEVLNLVPHRILHCWCMTPIETRDTGWDRIERCQYLGLYSLLSIAQGLGKYCADNFVQIAVISNNMREVVGGELVCPEKATLSGACKIIPQEYQTIKCCSIDLAVSVSDAKHIDKMVNPIIHETFALSSDTVVAYRGDYRWVETFEPVRLEGAVKRTPRLKERGIYLITGGLGGMGFALAEHLAKTLRASLVLTGRSYFPPRGEWARWLAEHDQQDSTSCKIRTIQGLEEQGAKFLVFQADVADLEQMQTVISESEDLFGKINGVVHSAGIIDHGGVIQRRPLEKSAEVLASKVTGTVVLDTVLADTELDFFVCCSSMGTVLYKSLFGEVGYCAANEFLDAFGYYRLSRSGSFTATINWCGWSEVGMAVSAIGHFSEVYGAKIETNYTVSPSEGVDVFLRTIGSEYPRVAVWPQELGIAIEQEKSFFDIARSLESTKPSYARSDLATPYAAPRNEREQAIAAIWQTLLGIEKVGIHDNFFELGGHSLLATQVISRLRDAFQVELQLHQIFEVQTIAGLSATLEKAQNTDSKIQAPAIRPISRKAPT